MPTRACQRPPLIQPTRMPGASVLLNDVQWITVPSVSPGFQRLRRLRGVGEFAVRIVLNQRNAGARAQFNEARLVRIRHHAARRILQVRHDHHRLDVGMRLQRERQRFDREAGARAGRNFERA